jgi:hypothetical protein
MAIQMLKIFMRDVTVSNIQYYHKMLDSQGAVEYLECILEYEAPEIGSRENGLQIEPDQKASCVLLHAFLYGGDVYFLLSDALVEEIEIAALEQQEDY